MAALRTTGEKTNQLLISRANRICDHVFDLLGSGPTDLGESIDWHQDFKSGYVWNRDRYFRRIRSAPSPGGYDIKVPWELSRCQHLVWLGQAYWLTGEEQYVWEYVAETSDWLSSNPWPLGVNWACTMDVAIRAINWLWASALFRESPVLTNEFVRALVHGLWIHGRHIFRNLENTGGVTANHYLSNLAGLVYLGICLPDCKDVRQWRAFGLHELEEEMFKQVYSDGVNFEASTSYHRLVLEIFLSCTIMAIRDGHRFSSAYMGRLENMLEFVTYITKPDGTVPLIGDNDNGRLHRLKAWESQHREWTDFRYLLAIGAVLFNRQDFALLTGNQWDEAVWLFGPEALAYRSTRANRRSILVTDLAFPDGKLYVMRHDDMYLAVDAGTNGQNGNGGHAHNDTLSVELACDGLTWIVDPGTYVYTSDYEARNQFRSTSQHNLVVIDAQEQNRFDPHRLFQLREEIMPVVHTWRNQIDYCLFDASYELRRDRVLYCHERRIFLYRPERVWIIQDKVFGEGTHHLKWCWHLSPSIKVDFRRGNQIALLRAGKRTLHVAILDRRSAPIVATEPGWVSRGYGERQTSTVLCAAMKTDLPEALTWAFAPVAEDNEETEDRILRAWKQFQKAPIAENGIAL